MGIFDALNTSVGGLAAQSFALQNISGNIANASTTGYKGIDTSFEDLIPDSTTPQRQVTGLRKLLRGEPRGHGDEPGGHRAGHRRRPAAARGRRPRCELIQETAYRLVQERAHEITIARRPCRHRRCRCGPRPGSS